MPLLKPYIPFAVAACLAPLVLGPFTVITAPDDDVLPCELEIILPPQVGWVTDLAVSANDDIILAGVTSDADFPTTPDAADRKCGDRFGCWSDGDDGFVMILSAAGEVLYSTFVGGDGEDHRTLVAPSPDGSIWVLLANTRFDLWNSSVPLCNGRQPVLMRIKPGSPVFHDLTCIGGPSADATVTDMEVGSDGTLWLFGEARAMQAVNAWQPVPADSQDLFVARYVPGREEPLFATFIGGRHSEWAGTMALTADGDAVLTGVTYSPDFPAVRPRPDLLHDEGSAPGWRSNAVIARVDSSGRWLEYSLEYGGSHWDSGASVAVDKAGNAFVAGYTGSADFPVIGTTVDPPRQVGESDATLVSVDPVGQPRFSARFGGGGWDMSTDVFARPDGSLMVFGYTNSPEFGDPAEPPPSPSFSQLFVRTTDSLCTTLRCLPRRLLSPTRHSSLNVVVQKGAHLYLAGDASDRDPAGRWLTYRGHYLKRWHVGRAAGEGHAPDEGNAPKGGQSIGTAGLRVVQRRWQ